MASLLVLWDVDQTLISANGAGRAIYEVAFREMFGRELPAASAAVPMAGRTDRAIALDILTGAGIADARDQIDKFQAIQAGHAPALADRIRARGRVLPGVPAALAAVARGRPGVRVIQSVLTGNVRSMADVKLASLGLTRHLDLDAGAYGTESEIRADLVPVAQRHAAARYGEDFSGARTVLVGDTPLDVEAALVAGARAVGVATGGFSAEDLAEAGAHAVLDDLSDTALALRAILGHP
ncbi:MAG TPA: haloacid dehalogenase-like hydrolase [Streptosporangiaceae bacterium]